MWRASAQTCRCAPPASKTRKAPLDLFSQPDLRLAFLFVIKHSLRSPPLHGTDGSNAPVKQDEPKVR
jgi:hypothetical protein